jgi:hypothetical protein
MWHAWERNVYKLLMGKPEGKRLLGRPRRRCEDGIRMDLREISWGSVYWIHLAQDRDRWRAVVNTVMDLRVLAPRIWLVKITIGVQLALANFKRVGKETSLISLVILFKIQLYSTDSVLLRCIN